MKTTRIGIVGYGNLARGVEKAISYAPDMELVAVFSRRAPLQTESGVAAYPMEQITEFTRDIDVMILCGGSANDLMSQGQDIAKHYHVVDSFDTHAKIEEHFQNLNTVAQAAQKVAMISIGWDPGLFSLQRLYGEAALPNGKNFTFWGRGISQGHSNAIRRIPGVADAKQYTVPKEAFLEQCRQGNQQDISAEESHLRECYVVLAEGADPDQVRDAICNMENYFAGYETQVHFISQEELDRNHGTMPHGGFVLRVGETAPGEREVIEYSLTLDSNPAFTASVLVAYARATMKLAAENRHGCFTIFDVPPAYLLPKTPAEIRHLL